MYDKTHYNKNKKKKRIQQFLQAGFTPLNPGTLFQKLLGSSSVKSKILFFLLLAR